MRGVRRKEELLGSHASTLLCRPRISLPQCGQGELQGATQPAAQARPGRLVGLARGQRSSSRRSSASSASKVGGEAGLHAGWARQAEVGAKEAASLEPPSPRFANDSAGVRSRQPRRRRLVRAGDAVCAGGGSQARKASASIAAPFHPVPRKPLAARPQGLNAAAACWAPGTQCDEALH